MLSVADIEQTVLKHTERNSPAVQEIASTLFQRWIEDPSVPLRTRIREGVRGVLSRVERREGRKSFKKITEELANRASQIALEDLRKRKCIKGMEKEHNEVFSLIEKLGRGVVYFGSARVKPGKPFYNRSLELGREVCRLLKSTSWSGAGPGLMEAPLMGAKELHGRVGGIKIDLNGHSTFEQDISPVLDPNDVAICNYFGPRKVGLVDAGVRLVEDDKTALIAFPGGYGTHDEFFEFLTLKQLGKLGTNFPVPVLLMNYDGFYKYLLAHLDHCEQEGMISKNDKILFHICETNEEALHHLEQIYGSKVADHGNGHREEDVIRLSALSR